MLQEFPSSPTIKMMGKITCETTAFTWLCTDDGELLGGNKSKELFKKDPLKLVLLYPVKASACGNTCMFAAWIQLCVLLSICHSILKNKKHNFL